MPDAVQVSFIGGQISESLFGRTDLDAAGQSLALARNCIIEPEGIVSRRPGTRVVLNADGTAWEHDPNDSSLGAGNGAVVLVPFKASNSEQYVLAFRHEAIDVISNGVVILRSAVNSVPWAGKDLQFNPDNDLQPGIKTSQRGDDLIVTHPSYAPRVIRRFSDIDWRIGFASRTRRKPSAVNLGVTATQFEDDDTEVFEFSFIVIGVGANDEHLSEVPIDIRSDVERPSGNYGLTIQALTVHDRIATVRANAVLENLFSAGSSVYLQGMTGAGQLEDKTFTATTADYYPRQTTKECVNGPWVTASTAALAEQEALRRLSPDHRSDISYETRSEGATRTEVQSVEFRFYKFAASQPDPVTDSEFTAALAADNFSGWTLDAISASLFERRYTDLGAHSSGASASVPEPYVPRFEGSGVASNGMHARNAAFTGSGNLYRASGTLRIFRSSGGAGSFTARARGCRSVTTANAYYLITFNTGVPEVDDWVSGGTIASSIFKISAKRHSRFKLTWEGVAEGVDHFATFQRAEGTFGIADRTIGPAEGTTIQSVEGDLLVAPPTFRDPFAESNPNCSCVYQQRRGFGGLVGDEGRTKFAFSRPGVFDQFDISKPLQDDDGIENELGSGEANEIRHMIPVGDALFVLTGGTVWSLSSGSDSAAFTPRSIKVRKEQDYGSSNLSPLTIGDTLLSVNEQGSVMQATSYSFEKDGYVTGELSVYFNEILRKRKIISWSYAEGHRTLVIAVLDNGECVCVTYRPEERIVAASTWDFGGQNLCRGVSVKNTDGIDPMGIFLIQKPDGKYALWSMEMNPDATNRKFSADGFSLSRGAPGSVVDKDQGEWLYYPLDGEDRRFDLRDDPQTLPADLKEGDGMVGYYTGYSFDTVVRTLPMWSLNPYRVRRAFIRLLEGSHVDARALPGGTVSEIARSGGDRDHLQGEFGVSIQSRDRNSFPQVEVIQKVPAPLVITGIAAMEHGSPEDAPNWAQGPVANAAG